MNNEKEQDLREKLAARAGVDAAPQEQAVVKEHPVTTLIEQESNAGTGEFISDTFAELQQSVKDSMNPPVAPTVDEVAPAAKVDLFSMLKDIKVDLNAIEISDGSVLDLERTEAAFSKSAVTQIVNCQSAYVAYLSAMKSQEIQNLTDSDVDFYTYKKRLFKTIHAHIDDTSVGKMDFPTFEKHTSYFDIETLIYGIYAQTFPYENKYTINCPGKDCGKMYTTIANNNTLVETRGQDGVFDRIGEVIARVKKPADIIDFSQIHKVKRVMVDECKAIFDIHIPSVYDYLEEVLSNTDQKFAEEYATSMGIGLFVKKMYLVDVVALQNTGKLKYFEITDKKEVIKGIARLGYLDSLQLTDEINTFTDKFKISYSLKNVTCPHCGHVIPEIPLSMEDLLFSVIRQGRSVKEDAKSDSNI